MHYINKKGIVLFSEGTGRVLSTFFWNNLFGYLIQKAYFPIVYSLLFHDLYTLKCSCINLDFLFEIQPESIKTNFRVKGHIILPNWDSDWTVTALSFFYRIVNVFNQQICLVNALHIITSSFLQLRATPINIIMMDPIPLFSHLCHVDRSSQVVSISLQSMYVTLKKKLRTQIVLGKISLKKVQFMKYTWYDQVGIDCLDLNHTKEKDVFVKHKCLCRQQRSNCLFLV